MNQNDINTLLNSFFISDQELQHRVIFREFSNSIASIIIDEFAENYLLNNPYLSVYLAHTDGSMLLKKMKTFVAYILTKPIDESFIKRVHYIGYIHYSIKLEPEKVSYGFWAINEVLNKLSLTNELVEENKPLISKLFKFVEHVMNNGYYIQKEKQKKEFIHELEGMNAQNELYVGFNIHKLNVKKVKAVIENKASLSSLSSIDNDALKCSFGKVVQDIQNNKQYEYILGDSAKTVNDIHDSWHVEFAKLKEAIQKQDKTQVTISNKKITLLTTQLAEILDLTLKESLKDGQLSLRSGIKSMRKVTELFYKKDYKNLEISKPKDIVYNSIETSILSEFLWAIKQIDIEYENLQQEDTINKTIRYNSKNIFISIKLKEELSNSYLHEIITLLLEVLELHFFVQERELSLIDFADKAENANRSKDMFLANMSHELRTPINAITGFSQILMRKKDTPESALKYVQKINIAGNNLLELVNTILDFAKLESGKMQFNPSLTNISKVLSEVSTLISPLAQKKGITLHMPHIVSLNLYIDNTLFKQVLINLLTNAIKFTHENGEVDLNILYSEEKHCYNFEIKDNGVGLNREEISKLFIAFSQVENIYQKEQKGSGLGLMISKNIIEDLHKGKIWVESVKGKGSSFFIDMPTPMIESNTYKVQQAPKGSKNILIVEDSVEYQKILIANLQETHTITITDTVNKAKELIQQNSYDFLILDFFLIDGISSEVLQFMELENIAIPSIVISAEDEIHISGSLSGSSNLECIINKSEVNKICASIRGERYKGSDL